MTPRFLRPDHLDGVTEALAGAEAPSVLGGGTALVPDLTHRKVAPDLLVDLSRAGLGGVRVEAGVVQVGASATYTDVLATTDPAPALRLLRTLAGGVTGGPQIRSRGTLVGSLSYANPASDVPAAMVALRATAVLASTRGTRAVPVADLLTGAFSTGRATNEVVVRLELPAADERPGYVKLKLAESSWPIVTAAALVRTDGTARVVLGGLSPVPVRLEVGADVVEVVPDHDDRTVADALSPAVAAAGGEPWQDVLADARYRARVAPVVAARALRRALTTTSGGAR